MKTPLQQIQSIFDYLPQIVSDGYVTFKTKNAGDNCDSCRIYISSLSLPLKAELISGCEFRVSINTK